MGNRAGQCSLGLLAALGLAFVVSPRILLAQFRVAPGGKPATSQTSAQNPFMAVLQPSEEAMTLLRRADEAVQRQDWKLAVDSLQRIVELPGEHVLTSDRQRYESARRHAHRRISALPPAGLQAYRTVHDGEAGALMAKAIGEHNEPLLHTVVDRYFCSGSGEKATITLVDWLIDDGRYAEASALLQQLGEVHPDSSLPTWAVPVRLAICAAGLGRPQRSNEVLSSLATRPADANLALPADRLEQVRRFVRTTSGPADDEASTSGWRVQGGGGLSGRMPLVEPTLTSNLPASIRITSTEPKQDLSALEAYARRRHLLPVRQAVTDGRLLFIKGENEILAFDTDSFAPLWSSRKRGEQARLPTADELQQQAMMRAGIGGDSEAGPDADTQFENDPLVRNLLHDSVGTGLSIAFNMVMTVERTSDPPGVMPRGLRMSMGMMGRDPFAGGQTSRIAAYMINTGLPRWRTEAPSTGNSEPGADEGSEFLSVPVQAAEALVATCRVNTDLFATVLDPRTGKIKRQVYLCGTGGGPFDSLCMLQPAAADGVVYIPTGRGLVLALDAAEWSIRWAVRYASALGEGKDVGWLPGPPITVSDALLIAPGDADDLLCFDRTSGHLRWRVKRDTFQYIIGATDSHVWIGGRDVQMVEIATGRQVWRRPAGDPGGRGALSGDRIYMPTSSGLKAFLALSGEPVQLQQPPEPMPLGNLLAWDGSLYSTSLLHMNRFFDLVHGYKRAVALHSRNPSDPALAIRLASLELMKHNPAGALAAMEKVNLTPEDGEVRKRDQIAHLQVQAMLELAADPSRPDALELLRKARSIAASPTDGIESVLALGRLLERRGQPLEACVQYLSLVLSAEGDQMMAGEPGVERRARGVAAQRIADLAKGFSEQDRGAFDGRMAEWLEQAVARNEQDAVARLAEAETLGPQSDRAALALADWAVQEMRFEPAEIHLRRVLDGSRDSALRAEAAVRLAQVYLEPDELSQPVLASRLVKSLEEDFATTELAASLLASGAGRVGSQAGARTMTGRQIASALRERLDARTLAQHQADTTPARLLGIAKPTSQVQPNCRPLCVRGERIEPLAGTVLLMADENRIEAHAAADNRLLWPAELRLLGDPAVEPKVLDPLLQQQFVGQQNLSRARGVVAGQTLIVNSDCGLHAVGLLTGRRLWSRPFSPPSLPGQVASGSDTWIWAHRGYVVSIDSRRRIEVASAAQGEKVLWRCSSTSRKWYAVRARGDYVVTVDVDLEQVDVFELTSGRHLGQCRFAQEPVVPRKVNITLYDDVICGPASTREVVALDLATPGVERWRVTVDAPLAQIFKPSPDLLATADRSGSIQVIDPKTGRKLMQTKVDCCPAGIVDGSLMDGVLYVYGYASRPADPNENGKQEWALAAIHMETGRLLWDLPALPARTFLTDEILRASSNAIPIAMIRTPQNPSPRVEHPGQPTGLELMLVDKTTGRIIGQKVTEPLATDVPARQVVDVQVWPQQIVVVAGTSHVRFPVLNDENAKPDGTTGQRRATGTRPTTGAASP